MNQEDVSVQQFRAECAAVSARFVANYSPAYLEFLQNAAYELLRGELGKRRTPKRLMELLDVMVMVTIAKEQVAGNRLDDVVGLCMAESLPGLTRTLGELSGGEVWRV